MPLDEAGVAARVAEELAQISDPNVAAGLAKILVAPRACLMTWDYGKESHYPAFIIAEHPESDTGIAFSEYGFYPPFTWGLVPLKDPGFGMDSGWFETLEEAFLDSWASAAVQRPQP